jgi:hypothetical protein
MAVRLGNLLLWASVLVAVGWVWLNYSTDWELYSVNVAAKQAGIIVLTGIAFRLLAAGKKT